MCQQKVGGIRVSHHSWCERNGNGRWTCEARYLNSCKYSRELLHPPNLTWTHKIIVLDAFWINIAMFGISIKLLVCINGSKIWLASWHVKYLNWFTGFRLFFYKPVSDFFWGAAQIKRGRFFNFNGKCLGCPRRLIPNLPYHSPDLPLRKM